ncbi:MAG: hypothetical protein Q8O30_04325 [Candidatus Omnitrophota bacterium]|nr:hypothetical protein [Candidatus Omnitrophota bacterium]
MNKEEVLEDFFKSLRTSITNSSIYFKEHPVFINSVENLKDKLYSVFNFICPLMIGIAPKSLLIEGKYLEKAKLYEELAEALHNRKIKNIEIKKGITTEELVKFLTTVSLPPKDILKNGGLTNLFKKANISHIWVEELDYSELLKGEGGVYKDLWLSLLQGALGKGDHKEIIEFADNFDKIASQLKAKDFLEDADVEKSIGDFLNYLKENDKDKFYRCRKQITKSFLVDKDSSAEQKFDKLSPFLKDLSEKEFSDILWEGIESDEHFDALSFQLFTKLITKEQHKAIASSLEDKIRGASGKKQKLTRKANELFSASVDSAISEIYRHALSSFLQDSIQDEGFSFDRPLVYKNYRVALLNIFVIEDNEGKLRVIIEKILGVLDKINIDADAEYIKNLLAALEIRKKASTSSVALFEDLESRLNNIIEKALVDGEKSLDFEYFFDILKKSSLDSGYYMEKIFNENSANSYALKLFFKFFSKDLDIFYQNLKKRVGSIIFLKKILKSLSTVDSLATLDILKYIFSLSDNFAKVEVLKAMQNLSFLDSDFLFSLLLKGDFFLKKHALAILVKNTDTKEKAMQIILDITNHFGIRNRILTENMRAVEEINLKEASPYLLKLAKRRFFWNSSIRSLAQAILREWDDGKN